MYLQLIIAHGLLRGGRVEMGSDADTGGQIRYVLELAKALAQFPGITQVDLVTRLIGDPAVDDSYRQPIEPLGEKCRIVRIPFGPPEYLRKELLWPFLDEFVHGLIHFANEQGISPAIVHGHSADAGYVGRHVAQHFRCPFIFTGHSLGIPKLEYLLAEGWTREKANDVLSIDRRIAEEQTCLNAAAGVIVSTRHERVEQYSSYELPNALSIEVIPPGTDLERFFPYYVYELPGSEIDERFKQARHRMQHRLGRFLAETHRPLPLAVCRPDWRKNIQSLFKAYGESPSLQAIANLAVFAGIRDDIESMPENEQSVLTDILLLMDRYDLYGKMAISKHHDSEFDVPELYRLAASTRGLFVNTAFIELFGLTAIEASATGLPFVVTENGGPQDIVANCHSGLLVDVNQQDRLIAAMLELLTDNKLWDQCSSQGINLVRQHYTWHMHCERYLHWLREIVGVAVPGDRAASNGIGDSGLLVAASVKSVDTSQHPPWSAAMCHFIEQLN
jgi:sucrose-phosphate synthase